MIRNEIKLSFWLDEAVEKERYLKLLIIKCVWKCPEIVGMKAKISQNHYFKPKQPKH